MGTHMLKLRPNCECCDKDLPPDAADALICTFECTFCADCAANRLPGGRCPNCSGELVRRPVRPPADAGEISGFDRARAQAAQGLRRLVYPSPRPYGERARVRGSHSRHGLARARSATAPPP